ALGVGGLRTDERRAAGASRRAGDRRRHVLGQVAECPRPAHAVRRRQGQRDRPGGRRLRLRLLLRDRDRAHRAGLAPDPPSRPRRSGGRKRPMSTATDLISQPAATPPYDIVRAAYAELQVTDLAASEHFYADLLGMIVTERGTDTVYLRGWEERVHHSLVLRRATVPAAARLGFRVRREQDLALLAGDLESQRLAVSWADAPDPGVGRVLRARAPFGCPLVLVSGMQQLGSAL